VTLQGDAREPARDEGQVVEGGPGARPQGAEAADAVAAQFGLDLDVLDDGGGVSAARLPPRRHARGLRAARVSVVGGHSATFQMSSSFLSKFHSLRPETTFRNAAGAGTSYAANKLLRSANSSAVGSPTTASLPSDAIAPPTNTTPSYIESASASPAS